MVLQQHVQQGEYGERLIDLLSAATGLTTSKKSLDVDGVDRGIHFPGRRAVGMGYPSIEVQIKTCRNPSYVDGNISYSLEAAHYNHLSGVLYEDFPLPRLLFLVLTPQAVDDYVRVDSDSYIFRHTAFWCNIMGTGEVPEGQDRKNVHIPTANLVTTESLEALVTASYQTEGEGS